MTEFSVFKELRKSSDKLRERFPFENRAKKVHLNKKVEFDCVVAEI